MNRCYPLLVFLACLPVFAEPSPISAGPLPLREWVWKESDRWQNKNIREVVPNDLSEIREEVVQELRRQNAVGLLLRLRDPEPTTNVIARYKAVQGKSWQLRRTLVECCSPWLLVELAPLLDEEETYYRRRWNEGGEGHGDYGYSMAVAQIMTRIIATSPEFPVETRRAAGAIRGADENSVDAGLLDLMRQWWKTNEQAIRKEAYAEATAPVFAQPKDGSGAPDRPVPPGEESRKEAMPTGSIPAPANQETSAVTAESKPVSGENATSSSGGNPPCSGRWRVVCGVALAGIVTAAAWAARKRRG